MERKDFLLEIGCEELPPASLRSLAGDLAERVLDGLAAADASGALRDGVRDYWFCSPRRLALVLQDVPVGTPASRQERLGPAVQAAFDKDGKPTRAAEGFAKSVGATVEELSTRETDKGERLGYVVEVPGKVTTDLLPGIVEDAMKNLPVPKRMRWGNGDVEFIRPIHWIVMLFGKDVVETTLFGVPTGRTSRGHRFHAPGELELNTPSDYVNRMEAAHVRVNDENNSLAEWIGSQVQAEADKLGGSAVGAEPGSELLEEVAALTEWPVPVVGSIPERFLELPEEILVTTLEVHQRYFPVRDKQGQVLPNFITFANIESADPERVREGNERVVVPRLEDAMFFWNADRKTPLFDRLPQLASVTFQKDLGSYGSKVNRVRKLAVNIATQIGGDAAKAERAADLAKCDLVTDMVFEFTELQGVIGRYYAELDGEDMEVAQAIFEQYLPRFAGEGVPETRTGQALAIADKLDTITGIFAIGQKPSGSKDPFALRRQALGVLRIIIERELDLDLEVLITDAFDALYPGKMALQDRKEIFDFFMERLRGICQEEGIRADVFNAVLANSPSRPLDFMARARAVNTFMAREEAVALAAANKRISNILRKAEIDVEGAVDRSLLADKEELALSEAIGKLEGDVAEDAKAGRYEAMLERLSSLRSVVDEFFDGVMVMAEDDALRLNRLRLLAGLRAQFNLAADFAQIQSE